MKIKILFYELVHVYQFSYKLLKKKTSFHTFISI